MVVAGLVMVPFPGPGWVVVFLGVLIWSTEFVWARRLHEWGTGHLSRWNSWVQGQALGVKLALGALTAAFVGAVMVGMVWVTGVPPWPPDGVERLLRDHLPRGPWSRR